MQVEINAMELEIPLSILGVNVAGAEAGNNAICQGRQIPWLQDTVTSDVWGSWNVTYRDVVVLDRNNRFVTAYNLTIHDLGNPDFYAALKEILLQAAR